MMIDVDPSMPSTFTVKANYEHLSLIFPQKVVEQAGFSKMLLVLYIVNIKAGNTAEQSLQPNVHSNTMYKQLMYVYRSHNHCRVQPPQKVAQFVLLSLVRANCSKTRPILCDQ